MTGHKAMGAHHSAKPMTTTWLTPPEIIEALGGWESFDLDPCGFAGSPIRTAQRTICLPNDGLSAQWDGRVYLNPPYTNGEIDYWLERLLRHGQGTALMFARTETEMFQRYVFGSGAGHGGAHGMLFIAGRLHFHYPDGTRAKANAGAPSVLCAYGQEDMDRLAACSLEGNFVPLRLARGIMVAVCDMSWAEIIRTYVGRHSGPVHVSDVYRFMARHPKIAGNDNWKAKVRQKLQSHCRRIAPATYAAA